MQLLVNKKDMQVYITLGSTWEDPVLFIEIKGKKKIITTDSGELEYDFGKFMLNENRLSNEELERALEIIDEISDLDSIEILEHRGVKSFTLNKKYMDKMKRLNEDTPTTI